MYEIQIHDAETKASAALSALKDKYDRRLLSSVLRRWVDTKKYSAFKEWIAYTNHRRDVTKKSARVANALKLAIVRWAKDTKQIGFQNWKIRFQREKEANHMVSMKEATAQLRARDDALIEAKKMYEIQIHDAETKAFAALSALKDKFLTIFLQNCTRRQLKLFKRKAFIKLLKNREIMICKEFCIETQTKNEAILYFKKMHEQEMTEAERSALQTFSRLKRQYQDRLLKNVVNRWREDYKRCAFLQWNSVIFQMQQKMHNIRHEKQSFALLEAKKNYQVRIKNAEESFAKRFSALGRKHQHVMLLRVTNLWLHFKKLGSFTVWKSAYAHAIALEKRFSSKSDVDQLNSMVALQKSYETKLMQAERNSSTFIQAIAVKLDDVTVQLREKKRELDEVKDYYDREILQAECSYSSALYGWKYKYKSLILKNVVHKWVKSFKTLVMKRLWMYSHASREQEKFDLKKREELKEVENVSASLFLKLESLQTKFSKNRKLKEHAQIDETNVLVEQKRASVTLFLRRNFRNWKRCN